MHLCSHYFWVPVSSSSPLSSKTLCSHFFITAPESNDDSVGVAFVCIIHQFGNVLLLCPGAELWDVRFVQREENLCYGPFV